MEAACSGRDVPACLLTLGYLFIALTTAVWIPIPRCLSNSTWTFLPSRCRKVMPKNESPLPIVPPAQERRDNWSSELATKWEARAKEWDGCGDLARESERLLCGRISTMYRELAKDLREIRGDRK